MRVHFSISGMPTFWQSRLAVGKHVCEEQHLSDLDSVFPFLKCEVQRARHLGLEDRGGQGTSPILDCV